MALSDTSLSYFTGSANTDLLSSGPSGTVDAGLTRYTGLSADSGVQDYNRRIDSPFNPFFDEHVDPTPAFSQAVNSSAAVAKKSAGVPALARVHEDARADIENKEALYGIATKGHGLNDREGVDAMNAARRFGAKLLDVDPSTSLACQRQYAAYISDEAVARGRHVADVEAQSAELMATFDYEISRQGGALKEAGASSFDGYAGNPSARMFGGLRALKAMQAAEKENGALYTKDFRKAVMARYCENLAMAKSYAAFSSIDEDRIMREAVASAANAYDGRPDDGIFTRFREASQKYADGYVTYTGSTDMDAAAGFQATAKASGATDLATGVRGVLGNWRASCLVTGDDDFGKLEDGLFAYFKKTGGFPPSEGDKADDVARDMAHNVRLQVETKDHVDLSKIATLYVPGAGRPPEPTKFDHFDAKMLERATAAGSDIVDRLVGGRPFLYNPYPFDGPDSVKNYAGKEMEAHVADNVRSSVLSQLGDKATQYDKEYADNLSRDIAEVVRFANTKGDAVSVGSGDVAGYKATVAAVAKVEALASNLRRMSGGKFKWSGIRFGDETEGLFGFRHTQLRDSLSSKKNVTSSFREALDTFIRDNPESVADEKTKSAILVAASYRDALDQIDRAYGTGGFVTQANRDASKADMAAKLGGLDLFGADGGAVSFDPYGVPGVADAESARMSMYEGQYAVVGDPELAGKQRILNGVVRKYFSNQAQPTISRRANEISTQIMARIASDVPEGSELYKVMKTALVNGIVPAFDDYAGGRPQGVDEAGNVVRALMFNTDIWDDAKAISWLTGRNSPIRGVLKGVMETVNAVRAQKMQTRAASQASAASINIKAQNFRENDVQPTPEQLMPRIGR